MTKSGDEQLWFDFASADASADAGADAVPPETAAADASPVPALPDELTIRQAVLAHLMREGYSGAALKVPGKLRKFPADIAAFRLHDGTRKGETTCCVMIDIRTDRASCLPECGGKDEVAAELRTLRRRQTELEAEIRRTEPELRETDELFDEFQSYSYDKSANAEYQTLRRRLEDLQQAYFKGTRMERLSRAAEADYLYLAVPEGLIAPEELFEGWGLWYIRPDHSLVEVRPAAPRDCGDRERALLVRNIARAAFGQVLFAQGVHGAPRDPESIYFTRPPRARRKRR